MNGLMMAILIVIAIILLVILYKIFKPYFLKYDTTLLMTGGIGSGKTLTTIKTAVVLIRKQRFYKFHCYNLIKFRFCNFWIKIANKIRDLKNLKRLKNHKPIKKPFKLFPPRKKPILYSNIPIHFKTHIFGFKREWANELNEKHILCLQEIKEYSVVVIDEMPQFINQFNWNQDLVQKNVNEFITFFRHYIGGYLLTNAQSVDDIVVQIRRKMNQAVFCYDFHRWGLFPPLQFYTIRMCDIVLSDQVSTMTTAQLDENTKLHFGLFPPRKTYDTRCYSERYKNVLNPHKPKKWQKIKTNKVLRLQEYTSPLDDITTKEQKLEQERRAEKLCRQLKESENTITR